MRLDVIKIWRGLAVIGGHSVVGGMSSSKCILQKMLVISSLPRPARSPSTWKMIRTPQTGRRSSTTYSNDHYHRIGYYHSKTSTRFLDRTLQCCLLTLNCPRPYLKHHSSTMIPSKILNHQKMVAQIACSASCSASPSSWLCLDACSCGSLKVSSPRKSFL